VVKTLAVGLVRPSGGLPRQGRSGRIELAARSSANYTLLDTFELGRGQLHDDLAIGELAALVERHGVEVVLTLGDIDMKGVRQASEALAGIRFRAVDPQ
jgi:hypothetical protein